MKPEKKNIILITAIIALCFLYTGSGYLSWMYKLIALGCDTSGALSVDILTEVIGYIFQALGILLYVLISRKSKIKLTTTFWIISIISLDTIFTIFSYLTNSLVLCLIIGYTMNLFHGLVAAVYIHLLTVKVPQQRRGITFGIGYGIGSLGSYVLSLLDNNNFLKNGYVSLVYALIAAILIAITIRFKVSDVKTHQSTITKDFSVGFIPIVTLFIVILSLVKGLGFYFPMADIQSGAVSLELTRLFYAIGLISAGFINDMDRKKGAILCLSALMIPFVLLFLTDHLTSSSIIWIIGYTFTGFYTVYRVIIFSDIAATNSTLLALAPMGLLAGRLGDAAGSLIGIGLNDKSYILIIICAVLFAITVVLFFTTYHELYLKTHSSVNTCSVTDLDKDKENDSCSNNKTTISDEMLLECSQKYGFSKRELDVVRCILNNHTNNEISQILFISENTVKFHMKNILRKANCSNRHEFIDKLCDS